jgi:hypothetical protein
MSTNFYWRETDESVCPCCGRVNELLHIGKSSAGWAFQLRIHPSREINSLEDWIKLWCKKGAIVNEYGIFISIVEMLTCIMVRPSNIKHSDYTGVSRGPGTWDLVEGDFS